MTPRGALSVTFALLAALSNAGTMVSQRLASLSTAAEHSGWRKASEVLRHPLWLLGGAGMLGGFLFAAVALYFGQVSLVQPLLVTELVFTLVLRRLWLRERLKARTWSAAALVCAGLGVFLLVAEPRPGHGRPDLDDWLVAAGTIALAAVSLAALSRRGTPARRAACLGAAAAVVWALDAAFVKQATEVLRHRGVLALLVHWPVYGVLVTGFAGCVLVQAALHAGPIRASQPALVIVDPLVSIVLGVGLFNERITNDVAALVLASLAIVVMALGVVLLSRWAPPAMGPSEEPAEERQLSQPLVG